MYSVTYDPEAGIIRMAVSGFWEVGMVDDLAAELKPALALARASCGQVLVLSDARDFPVQSAEVGMAFGKLEMETGPLRDRMAMVVGSTLAKMQGQRAVAGSVTAFFTSVDEAEAWLAEG